MSIENAGIERSEIIVHVGLHKTATTFLQKEIFPKLDLNIVSHEGLSGNPIRPGIPAKGRFEMMEVIKKLSPDATILVGVRDKDAWLRSLYSQYIKEGGAITFEDYLKRFNDDWLDFDRYIQALKKNFDKVLVYKYTRDTKKFVEQVCDLLDVEVPEYEEVVINPGYSNSEAQFVRKVNSKLKPGVESKLSGRYMIKWMRRFKKVMGK